MTVLGNGCTKLGIESGWQKIITGWIIVLAVTVDQLRHRRAD
jgi:ABC-type xylose transport system permease subunit